EDFVAAVVTVPRRGWSMEEGTFVEWLKRDGEPVEPGEPLFVLESEKAAENIEAIDGGVLRLGPDSPKPGDVVMVGQVIAHLVAEGEKVPARVAAPPVVQAARLQEEAGGPPAPRPPDRQAGRAVSPRARRVA